MKIYFAKLAVGILVSLLALLPSLAPSADAGLIPGVPDPVFLIDPPTTALLSGIAGSTAGSMASLAVLNTSVGIPGLTQGVVAGVASGADALCSNVQQLTEAAGVADNFSNLSLIGGSATESLQITSKLSALTALRACRQKTLDVLKNSPASSLLAAQELTRRVNGMADEVAALSVRIEQLKERQSNSFKDVLKAVSVRLLLNFSQQLTTRMVNSLVAKYKISNYLQYADAVASVVYTADYVKKNFPDSQNQLILRSILQNRTFQGQVLPMVRLKAKQSLGFIPSQLVLSQPDFYVRMAEVGAAQNDPYFLNTVVFNGQAAEARAAGANMAQQEISQGKGFVPVRHCGGAVSQQVQIDQQIERLSYEAEMSRQTLEKLKSSYFQNPSVQAASEVKKAEAEYQKSEQQLQALPQSANSAFVTLCSGISNPGAFVADSIQDYLLQHFQQAGSLNNSNLPFYGTFMQAVASNFLNNIFQGGKTNLQLLTEAGITAGNIATQDAVEAWDANRAQNEAKAEVNNQGAGSLGQTSSDGVVFKAGPGANASQVRLSWDATAKQDAAFVTLTVPGQSLAGAPALPLSGSSSAPYPSQSAAGQAFTLRVYAKNSIPGQNPPLEELSLTVRPSGAAGVTSPIIFGAYVETIQPRGPIPPLLPRGQ